MKTSNYISSKAFAKINLSLKVLGKTPNHYHSIESIITFLPDIYDCVMIKKSHEYKINITGKFSKTLNIEGGDNLVKNLVFLFKEKFNIPYNFNVIIKKNIPIGAGLAGGSADAAAIARLIIKIHKLKINKKEIINLLSTLGADIPACFFSYNQKVKGFGEKLTKLKLLNKKIWAVLIKPNINFNTKDIFNKFSKPFSKSSEYRYNYRNLILDLNSVDNDLEDAAKLHSPFFNDLLKKIPKNGAITNPRMTGSGSTIFLLFSNKYNAENYINIIQKSNKRLWVQMSKVLL